MWIHLWKRLLLLLFVCLGASACADGAYDGLRYIGGSPEAVSGVPRYAPPPDSQTPPVDPNEEPKVNPWKDTQEENQSTFAIDVDTASYSYARAQLNNGQRPQKEAVRVEEFINAFSYKYEAPKNKPMQVYVDGAISPYNGEHHILRVGLQSREMTAAERPQLHLTFLVDTSCSMGGDTRIGLAKKSLNILLEQLRAGDTVAVATYAGSTQKLLEPTDATQKDKIRGVINALSTGGGTAMGSGMLLAYEMASAAFVEGHENRVIVFSDGDANIGRTSHEEMLKTIESYVAKGITMTTVGFGMGNYRSTGMEILSNKGNGNNYYIDSEEEATRVFRERFIANMVTLARDVKIQVEFNKEYIARFRLVGYENRHIDNKDFRNDKVDAGELGPGHTVTALYEIQIRKEEIQTLIQSQALTPLVSVRWRYKGSHAKKEDPATEESALLPWLDLNRSFDGVSWGLRWATAAMGFGEILRDSPHAAGWTLTETTRIARSAAQSSDPAHAEMIDLLQKAQKLINP